VITDRDLVVHVLAESRLPDATAVSDVMSADPVTCHPDDPLDRAVSAMAQHQIRRVPIVNKDGELVGIIAQADIALTDDEATTAEVVKRISKPTPVHPSMSIRER
jgi:CBS domain-containing protein